MANILSNCGFWCHGMTALMGLSSDQILTCQGMEDRPIYERLKESSTSKDNLYCHCCMIVTPKLKPSPQKVFWTRMSMNKECLEQHYVIQIPLLMQLVDCCTSCRSNATSWIKHSFEVIQLHSACTNECSIPFTLRCCIIFIAFQSVHTKQLSCHRQVRT